MNTRESILSTALTLFAQKGYAAASIRDICKQVGIKESSLYFHFKSKQEIFDTLAATFEAKFSAALSEFAATFRHMTYFSPDLLRNVIAQYVDSCYVAHAPFLCILLREQNSAMLRKWLFDEPTELLRELFITLIEAGFIRRTSVSLLADAFHAPIIAFFATDMPRNPQQFRDAYLDYYDRFIKEFRV